MNPKKLSLIGIVIGLIVLGGLIFVANTKKGKEGSENSAANQVKTASPDVFRPGVEKALPTVQGGTREVIKEIIKTPEPNAKPTEVPKEVAIPKSAVEVTGASGSASIRTFEIKAENGKYEPSVFVVNNLDMLTIEFTAVDDAYNLFFPDFGVYIASAKGETKKRQFQASPTGEYKFSCRDCGKEIEGKLIVNQK